VSTPGAVLLAGFLAALVIGPIVLVLAHTTSSSQAGFSLRSPAVVIATVTLCGAVGAAAAYRWNWVTLLAGLPLLVLAGPAALVDLREHRLPSVLTLPFTGAGVVLAGLPALVNGQPAPAVRAVIAAAVVGVLMLVLGLLGGPGLGDVKFAPGLAAYLAAAGWTTLVTGLLAWSVLIAVSVVINRLAGARATDITPYGPALLLGTWLALLIA
jgi:leader peptidase (prepilin peptidase)/N-methyltransferase